MSTTKFLAIIFTALFLLSGLACLWRPAKASEGQAALVWVSDNNPARTLQIQTFNKLNPGVALSLDYGNAGVQKIILQCASGVGPDIFDFNAESLETLVQAGVLMDITEPAKDLGFDAATAGWPGGYDTYTSQGRQYGFPCNTGANILIYNKNVFDDFGVPYPKGVMTWDAFIEMAKTFSSPKRENDRRIFAISGLGWRTFFDSQRGDFFDESGRPRIADSPELFKAFEMHRDFLFNHRIVPTSVESKAMSGQGGYGAGNINQFSSGAYAMVATGHWSLIALGRTHRKQTESSLDRPLRIGAVLLPHFADREPSYRVTSRVAGINAGSRNRDEALKFLHYLSGPAYSELVNQDADWLPGNPKYADLGAEPGPPALAREELQAATKMAMAHGYTPRRSPFLLTSDATRVLGEQISRLESNPAMAVQPLLEAAQRDLDVLMRRNLDRSPDLKRQFLEKFGEQAYRDLP